MNKYLFTCNDHYTNFILEKKKRTIGTKKKNKKLFENHHIIPRAVGGSDFMWNLIPLSYEDHFTAHQLQYQEYGEYVDALFLRFRTNSTAQKSAIMRVASHYSQKANKNGFYSSVVQSCNGKKGGAKQTQKKIVGYRKKLSLPVQHALSQYLLWEHHVSNTGIIFLPNEISLVKGILQRLHELIPFQNSKITSLTSGLARVIKKERKSFCNWAVSTFSTYDNLQHYRTRNHHESRDRRMQLD